MIDLVFNGIASGCCERIDGKGSKADVKRPARRRVVVEA